MSKGRRLLYGLLAVGLIGLGAGGGTFATFNASTTNPNNTFTTGSLYLSNDNHSGTICFSDNDNNGGATNDAGLTNPPNGCGAVVAVAAKAPGQGASGTVTITNTGTITPGDSGTNFELTSTGCSDTYPTPSPISSVALSNTGIATIAASDSGDFVSQGVAVGDTVTGTGITGPATVATVAGDTLTLTGGSYSTEASTTLTFAPGSAPPTLCTDLRATVQETSGSSYYCWFGSGAPASGACPTGEAISSSATLANLTAATTQLGTNPLDVGGSASALYPASSRTFVVTLYLPDATPNSAMGLISKFNLTWTVTQ